ncbi:MAG: zinc-dependent alcohol dehydrogenase [Nitrososphaeria archaeon]
MPENRSFVLYKPGDLRYEEREIPRPGPGEIVVKVGASGLCPSDIKTYRHGSSYARYPVVLGHEFAGTVYRVGEGVDVVKEGDRVNITAAAYCGYCRMCRRGLEHLCDNMLNFGYNVDGAHADYVLVPRQFIPRGIFRIPDSLSFEVASMTEPFADVVHSVTLGGVGPDVSVAIVGDGPMGMLHIIASRAFGATKITLIGLTDWKLRLAEELGATRTINARFYKPADELRNDKADAVFLTVVSSETLEEAFSIANKGGRIVIFAGVPKGSVTYTLDPNSVHYNGAYLMGSIGYTYQEYAKALALIENGAPLEKLISHRIELQNFMDAIGIWDNKETSMKVIITRKSNS